MNNDVKQLLAKVCSFLARTLPELSTEFLKVTVPMLVNGTKEKNTFVKANCEFALIAVLKLKDGDSVHQVSRNFIPFSPVIDITIVRTDCCMYTQSS